MVDRQVLPIPDRPYDGAVYGDAKDPNATFLPFEPLRLRRRRPGQGRRGRALHRRAERREGPVEGTVPMIFSADETCDIGLDTASPVSDDYTPEGSRFTGTDSYKSSRCASTRLSTLPKLGQEPVTLAGSSPACQQEVLARLGRVVLGRVDEDVDVFGNRSIKL
jgi:hypothetical protein